MISHRRCSKTCKAKIAYEIWTHVKLAGNQPRFPARENANLSISSMLRIASAARLVEEPHAPLRLVDPRLNQARGRHIVLFGAKLMCLAQARDQRLIVG